MAKRQPKRHEVAFDPARAMQTIPPLTGLAGNMMAATHEPEEKAAAFRLPIQEVPNPMPSSFGIQEEAGASRRSTPAFITSSDDPQIWAYPDADPNMLVHVAMVGDAPATPRTDRSYEKRKSVGRTVCANVRFK